MFREAELSASHPVNAGVTDPDRRSWMGDNLIINRQRRPYFYLLDIYIPADVAVKHVLKFNYEDFSYTGQCILFKKNHRAVGTLRVTENDSFVEGKCNLNAR